ncbi:hypothetical protein CMUS01_03647 [Colletotrichum musicola]|uniref:FAR1 domain-containing protein n=1 Tax=Colletotrichum musicola TaxID=2175873 RepID=A0A8H6U551_9PEZI|nr:hypothetical protein CMUS01_03647 [Colletotrichum musicola]
MFGILGAVNVDSNTKTYTSFEELFAALKARMQKDGYKVVKSRTHRNKVGGTYEKGSEVVRCDLVCDRGGQPYKCTATQLKTTTKKTDCPWKAKAVNRKTMGAWLLTIICDEHNHEPRTPDPPTDEEDVDAEGDADVQDTSTSMPRISLSVISPILTEIVPEPETSVPAPDPATSLALAVAGVSSNHMRLTGDTFHNFKAEYRKMSKPERFGVLAQMQLRMAALYAIENEDLQRQERQARQERKHQEIEDTRRKSQSAQQPQQTPVQQPQQQQQHQPQQQQAQPQPQQHQQPQQLQHQTHQQHQHQQPQNHNHSHSHNHSNNHNQSRAAQQQQQQQLSQMSRDSMGGMSKHPFEQSAHDEHAQYRDRQADVGERHQNSMRMARDHMGNAAVQQTFVQQTPIPVPQFGMQPGSAGPSTNMFRHYSTPTANNAGAPGSGGTPTASQKRRGRPKKTGMDTQNLDASLHMGR